MSESFIEEIFERISSENTFELLDPYSDSSSWNNLSEKDKHLLAQMFIMKGEKELISGECGPITHFEIANQIFPNQTELLLKQAVAYTMSSSQEENLALACETSEHILLLDPQCFQALIVWGNSMVELGVIHEEPHFFYEANAKYERVSNNPLFLKQPDSQFYWYWGVCWHYIAKQSGEAGDFFCAINKYQSAERLGLSGSPFWNDYGNALVDLACLVSKVELFEHASELYHKVVAECNDFYEGWFNLACTDQELWHRTGEEKYFYSAHKSFEQASKLEPEEGTIWFKWAMLLSETGKDKKNSKLLEASLEKFLQSSTLKPESGDIIYHWADTVLSYGILSESLEHLKWAESLIQRALEQVPDESIFWHLFGHVYLELGKYFEDVSYFYKAIEKFKFGLSLNRCDSKLWHGMAKAHHLLSQFLDQYELSENAVKYYSRVTEFDSEMTPSFWNEWGVALMRMGEHTHDKRWVEAAAEKFEQSIRLFNLKNNPIEINSDWLHNYGCALDLLGDLTEDEKYYERAIKVLSQTLVLAPDHYFAKCHLALVFAHLGEAVSDVDCFQKALELFEEAISVNPEDDIIWDEWGVALVHLAELIHDPVHVKYSQKLMIQAEEKFMNAASLGNEGSYYHLTCLYSLQGNFPAAMHYIEKANQAGALPLIEDLIHDEWLKDLRSTNNFQQFLDQLSRGNQA